MESLNTLKDAMKEMEGSRCGTSSAEAAEGVADGAHLGSGGATTVGSGTQAEAVGADEARPGSGGATATVLEKSPAPAAGPLGKRNRSGAEKRRAKRKRERSQCGTSSGTVTPLVATPREREGHAGGKRPKGSTDTPPSAEGPAKKHRAQHTGTYAEAADPLTRVIIPEGYPEEEITAERLALLKLAVSRAISGIREGPIPCFRRTFLRGGAAVVLGRDEASVVWLAEQMGSISPWENAKLKVVGPEVLQRQHRAVVWVPGAPDEPAAVLERLERQNPGLSTGSCKIMAENVGATRDGRNLVLRIPESSVLKLKALDFKPYLGLDQVTFKVSGAQGGDKEGEKGPPMDES